MTIPTPKIAPRPTAPTKPTPIIAPIKSAIKKPVPKPVRAPR